MAGNLGGQKCFSSWKIDVGEFHEPIARNHLRPFVFHDPAFWPDAPCSSSICALVVSAVGVDGVEEHLHDSVEFHEIGLSADAFDEGIVFLDMLQGDLSGSASSSASRCTAFFLNAAAARAIATSPTRS